MPESEHKTECCAVTRYATAGMSRHPGDSWIADTSDKWQGGQECAGKGRSMLVHSGLHVSDKSQKVVKRRTSFGVVSARLFGLLGSVGGS